MRLLDNINPTMIEEPIQRMFWQVVKDNLKELNRGVAFSIGQGNSPTPINVDLSDYFFKPGRSGGQTAYGGLDSNDVLTFIQSASPFYSNSSMYMPATPATVVIEDTNAYGVGGGIHELLRLKYNSSGGLGSAFSIWKGSSREMVSFSVNDISSFFTLSSSSGSVFSLATTSGMLIRGDRLSSTIGGLQIRAHTSLDALQILDNATGTTVLAKIDHLGNISGTSFVLTGGDAFAQKAANETITGQWTFQPSTAGGKTVIKEDSGLAGTGYFFEFQDGAGSFLAGVTQAGTSNPGAFVAAALGVESSGFTSIFSTTLTADRVITIPNLTGTMCLIGAAQNLSSKTLTTSGNTLRASTAASGVAFVDDATTSKVLRFVLSGATGNNSIIITSSAARAYTLPDKTGTIPVLTTYNPQRVVYWPAHSFHTTASYVTLGTDPAGASGATFAPVGQTYVNVQFRVPDDYVNGGSITMYVATDGVDTNHYVLKGNYAVIAAAGAVDAAGTALTGATGVPPGTGNKLAAPGMGSITVTAGDFIRLTLYRDAGDAGDTCADNVIFFGAAFIYNADM